MKSDNSAVVYNAESTAAGLNRVRALTPLKYARSTETERYLICHTKSFGSDSDTPTARSVYLLKIYRRKLPQLRQGYILTEPTASLRQTVLFRGSTPRIKYPWRKPSTTLWKKRSRTQASACSLFPSIPPA